MEITPINLFVPLNEVQLQPIRFSRNWQLPDDKYTQFYVLLTNHPYTILQINPTRCTILLSIFISPLYIFRAIMCPSSGEIAVSMWHWYLSLCMAGVWSAGWSYTPTSRPEATQAEWQMPVSHRYSNFSWHGCPKYVERRNKYTEQNCAPSWIYLQECLHNFVQNFKKITQTV
jgi:hypothetical protein